MKFMTLWRPVEGPTPPEGDMAKLIEEMTAKGVLKQAGGWDPKSPCTMLKNSGGKITVTDGPYAESKEVIAGFAILNVKSKEEALMWCNRFLKLAGNGTSEMRELYEHPQA